MNGNARQQPALRVMEIEMAAPLVGLDEASALER